MGYVHAVVEGLQYWVQLAVCPSLKEGLFFPIASSGDLRMLQPGVSRKIFLGDGARGGATNSITFPAYISSQVTKEGFP
jgi:hypothetical protein